MNNAKPIVLVHGAWHGAWCWEKVLPIMEQRGLEGRALDLPGLGEDPTPLAEITLDRYAQAVREFICDLDTEAVLVGHSMGGVVITQVAEWIPDRIHALAYLAAFSPQNGESLADYAWNDAQSLVTRYKQVNEEEGSVTVRPDKLQECFYGLCDDADARDAIKRLRPQALAPLAQPVRITPDNYGRVRRCYIACAKDLALTWPLQQRMQANARLDELFTLDTDHSPFYSCPEDLVDCLAQC